MPRKRTKDITLSQKEMLKYFKEFDPIAKKYQKCFDCCKAKDYDEAYRECYEYEYNRWLPDLTKKEYGDVYANLKLVYEDKEKVMEILDIYELVYEKVIVQYLNIDGMERLFSEKYINFEWEMHLGIDYAEHAMKYYRDHFIHQVRDAYFMDILLQEGYLEKVKRILSKPGNSKISQYVCKLLGQQLERGNGKDILKISDEDMLREYYLDNIIYMSSYMSALFHDIGYPEVANMQSGRNILGYIANVYSFGSGHVEFDRIISVLQNTLLFRIVSPNEIRERIEREKIDHGAVSSLMFLLHFYENGAIYGLEPYKRCAVEIAGLAIYNHTNSYAYIKGKPSRHYYRNVFTLNPISYLLRICDDMQEWGRIYFEISPNANIIVCNKCHTPIVRRDYTGENNKKDVYYVCNCNKTSEKEKEVSESSVFETVFSRGSFPYRRLYNVTVCEELTIKKNDSQWIFELDYDLERLLNVAYINPSYAKQRIKELNQLKKMFVRQDVMDGDNTTEITFLRYFVTPNILLIKSKIVEEYINQKSKSQYIGLRSFAKLPADKLHNNLSSKARRMYDSIKTEFSAAGGVLQKYADENFWIYIYVALVMHMGMIANEYVNQNNELCNRLQGLWKNFQGDANFSKDALHLMKDCCLQASRLYLDLDGYDFYPDRYFEQFNDESDIVPCCVRFSHSDNYQPLNQRDDAERYQLDAYTDLYLFRILLREIDL